jgi:cell division protein FtsL
METIVITVSEKQTKKIKAFLDQEKVAYQTKSSVEKSTNKNKAEESPYDPEFVKMILRSSQQAKEGKITKIAINDLWK